MRIVLLASRAILQECCFPTGIASNQADPLRQSYTTLEIVPSQLRQSDTTLEIVAEPLR